MRARVDASSSQKPAAASPLVLAPAMPAPAARARTSGVMAAVASAQGEVSTYDWGPRNGMNSGFSGASRANSSDRRTARSRLSASNSLMDAVPLRLPKVEVTSRVALSLLPLVVTVFLAYRMLPPRRPVTRASQESARENARTRSSRRRASRSEMSVMVRPFGPYSAH